MRRDLRRAGVADVCFRLDVAGARPGAAALLLGDDPYAAGQHRGIDIGSPSGALGARARSRSRLASQGPSPSAAEPSRSSDRGRLLGHRPASRLRGGSARRLDRGGRADRDGRPKRRGRVVGAPRLSRACGEAASRTATSIRSSSCRGQRLRRARRPRARRNRLLSGSTAAPAEPAKPAVGASAPDARRRPLAEVSSMRGSVDKPAPSSASLLASRQPFVRPRCERPSAGPAAVAVRRRRPDPVGARGPGVASFPGTLAQPHHRRPRCGAAAHEPASAERRPGFQASVGLRRGRRRPRPVRRRPATGSSSQSVPPSRRCCSSWRSSCAGVGVEGRCLRTRPALGRLVSLTPMRFYLTTPIYYVNATPAHRSRVHDDRGRCARRDTTASAGEETFFLTGTDEHASEGLPRRRGAGSRSEDVRRRHRRRTGASFLGASMPSTTSSSARPTRAQALRPGVPAADLRQRATSTRTSTAGLYCVGCEEFKTRGRARRRHVPRARDPARSGSRRRTASSGSPPTRTGCSRSTTSGPTSCCRGFRYNEARSFIEGGLAGLQRQPRRASRGASRSPGTRSRSPMSG